MATDESENVFESNLFRFQFPFGMLVAGPTQSGKTTFIKNLIKQRTEAFHPPPASILYSFGEYSEYVDELEQEGIKTYQGMPPDSVIDEMPKPLLFLIDDQMDKLESESLNALFTRKLHHRNLGVCLLVQSAFLPILRVPKLNSSYLVLLRSPAYKLQIKTIGQQLYPGKVKSFLEAYDDAVSQPWGYLVINLKSNSPQTLQLLTNILPSQDPIIYQI